MQEFAQTAETIFKDTERRADLDKWYIKLVAAMFEVIPAIANDHHKTPSEVIKMGKYLHHTGAIKFPFLHMSHDLRCMSNLN